MQLESYLKIMDVASELRRAREAAKKQLDISEEKAAVKERILKSAEITGEKLTDSEVDAAIEAFYRGLYRFKRPRRGLSYVLAKAYICRPVFYSFIVVPVLFAAVHLFGSLEAKGNLESSLDAVLEVSKNPEEAKTLYNKVQVACAKGDSAICEAFTKRFRDYSDLVLSEYQVKIVNAPNAKSGIDRFFTDEGVKSTSGYYLIVEALDPTGKRISREIRNRETGRVERVRRWGELVPKEVFDRIARDKEADGIVDESLFAFKELGSSIEEVQFPLKERGQITKW